VDAPGTVTDCPITSVMEESGDGGIRGRERVKKSPNISAKKCAIARTLEM